MEQVLQYVRVVAERSNSKTRLLQPINKKGNPRILIMMITIPSQSSEIGGRLLAVVVAFARRICMEVEPIDSIFKMT